MFSGVSLKPNLFMDRNIWEIGIAEAGQVMGDN